MLPLITDALWQRLQPVWPPRPPRRFHFLGRKPLDHRKILTGIILVRKTGITWDDLPAELGCGGGQTCRCYLQRWRQAGVWRQLHALLLAERNAADQIDEERARIDASLAEAPAGGDPVGSKPGPNGRNRNDGKATGCSVERESPGERPVFCGVQKDRLNSGAQAPESSNTRNSFHESTLLARQAGRPGR